MVGKTGEFNEEKLNQFMEKQERINEEIIRNQTKILEKLELFENKQDGKEWTREDRLRAMRAKYAKTSTEIKPTFDIPAKCFVMKHTFKNISKLENLCGIRYSDYQEHYGVNWRMLIFRNDDSLSFHTQCAREEKAEGQWSIEASCEVKVVSKNENLDIRKSCDLDGPVIAEKIQKIYDFGWLNFEKLDTLREDHSIDDSLTFEVSIHIKRTDGIYMDNLRCFDDPECSDIALIVKDKKFHVSKLYLATHSTYFKTMFLGMFSESKKSEICLAGIDAADFQKYLEVLYGESAIDEYDVEGILLLADKHDTQLVIRKCEEFLLKESRKTKKKKFELAIKYSLKRLKEDCLSYIKTLDDIRELVPGDFGDMDSSLLADLFGAYSSN